VEAFQLTTPGRAVRELEREPATGRNLRPAIHSTCRLVGRLGCCMETSVVSD